MLGIRETILRIADELQRPFEEIDWGRRTTVLRAEDITTSSYKEYAQSEYNSMPFEEFTRLNDASKIIPRGYIRYDWEQMVSYLRAEGIELEDIESARNLCDYLEESYGWKNLNSDYDWFGPHINVYYGPVGLTGNNFMGVLLKNAGYFVSIGDDAESAVDWFFDEEIYSWGYTLYIEFKADGRKYSVSLTNEDWELWNVFPHFSDDIKIKYIDDNGKPQMLEQNYTVSRETVAEIFKLEGLY